MAATTQPITVDNHRLDPADPEQVCSVVDRLRSLAISDIGSAMKAAVLLVECVPEDSPARSRVLAFHGHALCYANDFTGAIDAFEQALVRAREHGSTEDIGNVELARVQAFARLGRMAEAEAAARAAFQAFEVSGLKELSGKAAANLAITMRMTGRLSDALEWFDRAASCVEHPVALAAIQSNRAETYRDLDRYAEALACFHDALGGFASSGHHQGAAIVEGNLAELHARMGQMDRAIEMFERAHARFERAGAPADAARLFAEHCDALRAAGAWRRAARMYRGAAEKLLAHGLVREAARVELGLGVCMTRLAHFQIGISSIESARSRAREATDPALEAECMLALAEAEAAAGNQSRARSLIESVMEGSALSPMRQAVALCQLAELQGDSAGRADTLKNAQSIADDLGLEALRLRVRLARGRVADDCGRHDDALAVFEGAIQQAERMGTDIGGTHVRTAFAASISGLLRGAIQAAIKTGQAVDRVFALVEQEHSLAHPSGIDRSEGLDPELRAMHTRLQSLYAKLGPLARADADAEALRRELVSIEDRVLRRQDLLGSVPGRSRTRATLKDTQKRLGPHEAMAIYFMDDGHISAIVITPENAAIVRSLATEKAARSLVRQTQLNVERFMCGMSERQSSSAMSIPDRCSELLIAPLLRHVPNQVDSIAISPIGLLHELPLAAGAASTGARTAALVPGASSQAEPLPTCGQTLVIGVADEHAPGMEVEARAVAERHPGCIRLIGSDATAERVLAEIREANLVHLACHGVFDPDFPLSSRVLCSDRWITARELAGAIRPGSAVILAGCDTARSHGIDETGQAGLARSLLNAGASCVVGTQWALHDDFAVALFSDMHDLIASRLERGACDWKRDLPAIVCEMQRNQLRLGRDWPLWAGISAWRNL